MTTITRHICFIILCLTLSALTVMWFDVYTAQKKNDIKPVVINIAHTDYVSMVTGRDVEWDIKEKR